MVLDKAMLERVAWQARLKLTEEEKEAFLKEMNSILEAFSQISEVEADCDISMHPVEIVNVLREDEEEKSLTQEQALANTRNKKDGYFKGPAVL